MAIKTWLLTAVVLVFGFTNMQAQSLSPQVIASTGGYSSNANGSLSYTVGEMTMVQTVVWYAVARMSKAKYLFAKGEWS